MIRNSKKIFKKKKKTSVKKTLLNRKNGKN